jgi:hypothetical protein
MSLLDSMECCSQDSRLKEARQLLDALEVELRAADEQAAAAGTASDARIPLSQPPPELAQAQVRELHLLTCFRCCRALAAVQCSWPAAQSDQACRCCEVRRQLRRQWCDDRSSSSSSCSRTARQRRHARQRQRNRWLRRRRQSRSPLSGSTGPDGHRRRRPSPMSCQCRRAMCEQRAPATRSCSRCAQLPKHTCQMYGFSK